MELKIGDSLDSGKLYQRQCDVPGRVTSQDDWSFRMKTARKADFQVFRTENMSRFCESGPHVPRSVFSMPLKPPSVALGRSKIAFTRQTGQARDLQSNLSSMAPRSQGCKRCSGVDTVRQLFLCLDILSVGTQFYWKQFPSWKTSWIEIQSEGDILFIFRNCLLPQNHVLEYPSLTPYRDGYMRCSIKCFRILRCRCIPTFSCEKTALADIYLLDAPLLSLSRGILACGAAS